MTTAKDRARKILRDLHIDDPEILMKNLKEICCERGAFVREGTIAGAEARLTVKGDKGIITIPADKAHLARTRFSLAHELGHFELHREREHEMTCTANVITDFTQKKTMAEIEAEANEFAAELLLPDQFLRPEMAGKRPSLSLVESLATKFQTSFMATVRRFLELTPEACAAVFFRDRSVQFCWSSKYFSNQEYEIHSQLSPGSVAFDMVQMTSAPPKAMTVVDAMSWLNVPDELSEASLLEETRYFENLNLGVSLLWLTDPILIRH